MDRGLPDGWLRVPVGPAAARWTTRAGTALVLFVVHNVTSATRLLDVLPLFDGDLRIQGLATCTGSSPYQAGVPELLAELGLPVLPWEQAKATPVSLAISASYGGELHAIQGKLSVLSHGVGYNKKLEPGAGSREPGAGSRAPVFGLSPQWLLHDGKPIATATILSHPEQLHRLHAACPEAADTAVLGGDPCYDRILAALPYRERIRRALGVAPGQRLVLLNSTWNPDSLFSDAAGVLPSLLSGLTGELPLDEYRVAAALHPNIWSGHGPGQVRSWLERARRAGLLLIPPLGDWRQALVAADCVIGDHGSVTYYAAALGIPVLLGTFAEHRLDPASPVAELGRLAPRLRTEARLRPQLDSLLRNHQPDRFAQLAEQTSSAPGHSAELLRRIFYELIDLPEPSHPATLDRLPLPTARFKPPTAPVHVLTRVVRANQDGLPEISVTRYADSPTADQRGDLDAAHTSVHEDTDDLTRLSLADIVVRHGAEPGSFFEPSSWTAEARELYPNSAMAAYLDAPGTCVARIADDQLVTLTCTSCTVGCDPAALADALLAWIDLGEPVRDLADGVIVTTGATRHQVTVNVCA